MVIWLDIARVCGCIFTSRRQAGPTPEPKMCLRGMAYSQDSALKKSVRGTTILWARGWWDGKSRYLSVCVAFLWTVVERDPSGRCGEGSCGIQKPPLHSMRCHGGKPAHVQLELKSGDLHSTGRAGILWIIAVSLIIAHPFLNYHPISCHASVLKQGICNTSRITDDDQTWASVNCQYLEHQEFGYEDMSQVAKSKTTLLICNLHVYNIRTQELLAHGSAVCMRHLSVSLSLLPRKHFISPMLITNLITDPSLTGSIV